MRVSVLKGFARHGVRLAVLFFSLVGMAAVSHSQTAATAAQPATKAAVPAGRAPMAPNTAPERAQMASPTTKPAGGMHEGIKVHGHWMIEVRSPDGKLVSHTEFENLLFPNGGAGILPQLFTATQAGGFAYTPGEWGVLLGDPSSSPCSAGITYPFNNSNLNGPILAFNSAGCALAQFAPPAAIYPVNCSPAPNSGCSYNLQVGQNGQGNTLALTGSVVSTSAGTISQVQTLLSTCSEKIAPIACPTETSPDSNAPTGGDFVVTFTAATLPQSSTSATLCGGAGQISCAVDVPAAGDTINVSVIISFQ